MTFKEAKKILKKEGFHLALAPKVIYQNGAIREFEKPEVCEAIKVANANRWTVGLSPIEWDEQEARLKKEYEENTKAPDSGVNPALNESASLFNDALLDELRKKIAAYKKLHFYDTKTLKRKDEIIEELRDKNAELLGMVERMKEDVKDIDTNLNAANKTNKCLNKKVVELTKIKGDLNSWISGLYFCIHHNNDNYKYKLKRLGKEIAKLNGIIHDKNAVLSDVAEELRLTKIREKNLAELGLKYVGENEKLKKELADKVVDKIDARALKSAESALAYKEKVIAEKDEVIADLGNELAATKKELEEKTQLVEIVRNASKDYCDYGVAANEFIKKLANLYVTAGNKGTISNEMFERCKNYQTYGFPAKFKIETKKEINDIARGKESKKPRIPTPEEPKHDKSFEDFVNRTIDNYNRRAANFGWIGSNDGNGIIYQMVGADFAEEGGDQSASIVVQCDNGITLSKEEAEIIERCTKNGTELHYSEKDGLTYTNVFGEEMPIRCLRGMFHVFTDEEIENMKK